MTGPGINSELNDVKTKSHVVTVIYPPGRPEIQGLAEGEILRAGQLKRLTCISMSGNPLAKLTWYVGVRQVASVYRTVENYATAELSLVPDQSENGAHVRCEATNPAIAESGPFVTSK